MTPIYIPKGKAKEYGDYALNIYTGCPHRCYYCFAPNVLRKEREAFHGCVEPRKDIVRETLKQLEKDKELRGKLIHLCFTCDPYPTGYDTTPTREIIQLLKDFGNHVQILTKGEGSRDFDILDGDDWYGITVTSGPCGTGASPGAIAPIARIAFLDEAKRRGIRTWVSFEPVLDDKAVLDCIRRYHKSFDKVKIGKLNYWPSSINWKEFGREAEELCQSLNLDYYIKDSLRTEMEK